MSVQALALYAESFVNADMFYATRLAAPDPFVYLRAGNRTTIVVNDLEYGRALACAQVNQVIRQEDLDRELKRAGKEHPTPADRILHLLREAGSTSVAVPATFPVAVADRIRSQGIEVRPLEGPVFPERAVKSPDEVRAIEGALRVTEAALATAERILRESTVQGDRITFDGEPLTSEILRGQINATIASMDAQPGPTIVAGGDQGCDPHEFGRGPLRPHQTIVIDVFPRSLRTFYWGDMTRTFVKGKASEEIKKLYRTVEEGQKLGFDLIRAGADGKEVHRKISEYFESKGYRTAKKEGKMVGFFHGTGHGIGLDIHEAPRIGKTGGRLESGNVVTVEPGLYYFGLGGVRIEDVVLVEDGGCRLLSRYNRVLEIE